jgi:glucokinase
MGTDASQFEMRGPVLVGDVGGTNCRLALAGTDGAMLARWRCTTDDFPTPVAAIQAFLRENPDLNPAFGAVAIAAPTGAESVQLTNSGWRFDRLALEKALGLSRMLLVNDLAAQARAVLDAPQAELIRIGDPAVQQLAGTVAVVGPGTGLGVARLEIGQARPVAATEGGHVGFAPNDDVELELLRLWRPHLGRVTNEHAVSGPGLVRVYRGLGALNDHHVEPIEGPEIMRRALLKSDALCTEAVDRFAKILGAVCADIVLAQGAGALALVGGIPEAMLPVLQKGGFRARFEQRGPGGAFLSAVPSFFVARADLGLIGSFAWLKDELGMQENA